MLEKFPLPKIKILLKAHLRWLSKIPLTPEMQILLDRSIIAFGPLDDAISTKSIDVSGGSASVVGFDELKKTLPLRINEIKLMVKMLMKGNKAILKLLKLDIVRIYYLGKQSDILANFINLETLIKATPELVTVIPVATALKEEVDNSLKFKTEKFNEIISDRTDITPLILDAKIILILNFCSLHEIFKENLANVCNYFPIEEMKPETHTDTFLPKNKYIIKGYQGEFINLIDVELKYGNYIQADCRKCLLDIYIFLASEITNVVPLNAQRINKGERIIFKSSKIGSSTQKYLMIVFVKNEAIIDECNFILTIDKLKPQRKNIIVPKTATPKIIVEVPEIVKEIIKPVEEIIPPEKIEE